MKKFTFVYQLKGGGSAAVIICAKNQGVAISQFKRRYTALKIIKILKEKK